MYKRAASERAVHDTHAFHHRSGTARSVRLQVGHAKVILNTRATTNPTARSQQARGCEKLAFLQAAGSPSHRAAGWGAGVSATRGYTRSLPAFAALSLLLFR